MWKINEWDNHLVSRRVSQWIHLFSHWKWINYLTKELTPIYVTYFIVIIVITQYERMVLSYETPYAIDLVLENLLSPIFSAIHFKLIYRKIFLYGRSKAYEILNCFILLSLIIYSVKSINWIFSSLCLLLIAKIPCLRQIFCSKKFPFSYFFVLFIPKKKNLLWAIVRIKKFKLISHQVKNITNKFPFQ